MTPQIPDPRATAVAHELLDAIEETINMSSDIDRSLAVPLVLAALADAKRDATDAAIRVLEAEKNGNGFTRDGIIDQCIAAIRAQEHPRG